MNNDILSLKTIFFLPLCIYFEYKNKSRQEKSNIFDSEVSHCNKAIIPWLKLIYKMLCTQFLTLLHHYFLTT